ncbi:hypothetical protein MtrunA17_Chr5g0396701 [Medicago truncatula]|uniref:Uncharacterized protein n=1 Tax=Medicago truncatula TaxID=3880 RepID=A0A396HLR4_MEDTR|nr:hypothetical protein MtrunA17_Chr5g0396701 [Medicago truncatula]
MFIIDWLDTPYSFLLVLLKAVPESTIHIMENVFLKLEYLNHLIMAVELYSIEILYHFNVAKKNIRKQDRDTPIKDRKFKVFAFITKCEPCGSVAMFQSWILETNGERVNLHFLTVIFLLPRQA